MESAVSESVDNTWQLVEQEQRDALDATACSANAVGAQRVYGVAYDSTAEQCDVEVGENIVHANVVDENALEAEIQKRMQREISQKTVPGQIINVEEEGGDDMMPEETKQEWGHWRACKHVLFAMILLTAVGVTIGLLFALESDGKPSNTQTDVPFPDTRFTVPKNVMWTFEGAMVESTDVLFELFHFLANNSRCLPTAKHWSQTHVIPEQVLDHF